MPEKSSGLSLATLARFSWLFPTLSWLSQIILGLSLRNVPGLGVFWTLMAVVQTVLMVLGFCYAIKVLAAGRGIVGTGNWLAAVVGLILSGGTFLLIAGLIFGFLKV